MNSSKAIKFAAVLGLAALMAGCAGVGNERLRGESEQSVASKIAQNKTTKNEVREMFGSPSQTTFTDEGLEIWRYEFSKMSADAVSYIPIVNMFGNSASGIKKELVVLFDDQDRVKRYSMSESEVTTKTGIFNN